MTGISFASGWTFLPTGMPPDHHEAHAFGVRVVYRGHYVRRSAEAQGIEAWYAIESLHGVLSRGGKWTFQPQRFQLWQHRFTLREALEQAEAIVDTLEIHGTTWAAWSAKLTAAT